MTDQRRNGPPQLLTIARTAEALDVSSRTVRREIDEGALPTTRVRGQIRIHPADLDDYLRRSRQNGRSWLDLANNDE